MKMSPACLGKDSRPLSRQSGSRRIMAKLPFGLAIACHISSIRPSAKNKAVGHAGTNGFALLSPNHAMTALSGRRIAFTLHGHAGRLDHDMKSIAPVQMVWKLSQAELD
jgi:hypothetical protein